VVDLYASLLAAWPYGERALFVAGCLAIFFVFYWMHTLLLYVFCYSDLNMFPQYKIQPFRHPPRARVMKALQTLIVGYIVVQPIGFFAMHKYILSGRLDFSVAGFPSVLGMLRDLVLWHIMFDTWFYWSHRCMHYFPRLYGLIHKQHHTFNTPIGLAAAYAHPIEELVVNDASLLVGPLLFPSHFVTMMLYLALRYHETVDAHSGYAFPWSPWSAWDERARRHDFHHSHNVGNYGAFLFWDWIMQTDQSYKAYRIKQRLLTTPTTTPNGSNATSTSDSTSTDTLKAQAALLPDDSVIERGSVPQGTVPEPRAAGVAPKAD